ncbi:hypothetical protein Droror1_Dr00006352 [Drosera rotundifolia]
MARPRVDMKAFYKNQKKKAAATGGVSKKTSSSKARTATPKHSASVGSDVFSHPRSSPVALLIFEPSVCPEHQGQSGSFASSHPLTGLERSYDYDDTELFLRQFDLNMAYGPCIGISRVARWERSHRMGLNPPREVEKLLKSRKANEQCVWDDRV